MLINKDIKAEISVILPVRDNPDGLRACLAALARQETQYPFEVLVVDNNDRFCAADYEGLEIGSAPLRVLHEARRGSDLARNLGIRHARGRVCAFTDSDCLPQPDWLEQGMGRIQQGAKILGGEVTIFYNNAAPTWAERFDLAYYLDQYRYISFDGFAVTANLFVIRVLFDDVGLFNEDLYANGDREWCLRAARSDYRVTYAPEAVVFHPARETLAKILKKAARLEAGYREHSGRPLWKGLLRHLSAVIQSLRRRGASGEAILETLLLLVLLLAYLRILPGQKTVLL